MREATIELLRELTGASGVPGFEASVAKTANAGLIVRRVAEWK
jgi:putative aminopeptidase FrvX